MILIMAPGFLFSLVLYPKLGDFDFWARVGASFGLGILVAAYIGFAIARAGMLQLVPFVGVDLTLCVVFAILAYFRGGFEVISAYTQAALKVLRKLRPPKPPKPPIPQLEQPKEQPPEQKGESG